MIPDNLTKIVAIKGRKKNLNIIGKVESKENDPYPHRRHSIAEISDETGKIRLVLWNDQVDQVDVGDVILVLEAFTKPDDGRLAIHTWQKVIQKISSEDLKKYELIIKDTNF